MEDLLAPLPANKEPIRFERVDPEDPRCLRCLFELTAAYARTRFAGFPNAEDLVLDAISLAWENVNAYGKGTPYTVARLAVRQAADGRQFSRSSISVDESHAGRRRSRRTSLPIDVVPSTSADPAQDALTRVEFERWLATLQSHEQAAVRARIAGYTDQEIAEQIGFTRGGVQMLRARLRNECFRRLGVQQKDDD